MVAARFGGARLFLHESNAIPGRANRWLSRWAHQAFVGFPAAAKRLGAGKVVATGTPVRPEFGRRSLEECRRELGLDPTRPLLVVTGGSQGARGVNDLVMRGLSRIVRAVPGLQFYHLTGGVAGEKEKVMAKYASESASAQVETFSNRMDLLLGAATAAIGRAGASFLAELCALRLPAVLVPYPFAADDHQTHNAASFLDSGAAKVFREESGEIEPLVEMVRELVEEDGTRAKMRDALAQWHRPEAANQIAEAILDCVAESRRRAGAPISAEEKRSPVPRCCLVFRAGGAA
jgi:UDP-N-acetylglucosamine--N-acetylmuramyl-(pentapeptide) pyrophosphoryl-undecaprenol N-acetylglucosamine transferase